jgi:hypothetical protein
MYLAAAVEEALRKKERGDESQFTTKIGGKKLVWMPVVSVFVKFHSQLCF